VIQPLITCPSNGLARDTQSMIVAGPLTAGADAEKYAYFHRDREFLPKLLRYQL